MFEAQRRLGVLLGQWYGACSNHSRYVAVCGSCSELVEVLEQCLQDEKTSQDLFDKVADLSRGLRPSLLTMLAAKGDMRGIVRCRKLAAQYPNRLRIGDREFHLSIRYFAAGRLALAQAETSPGVLQTELYEWMALAVHPNHASHLLWVMEKSGLIGRKRKGNTYAVHPPPAPYEA